MKLSHVYHIETLLLFVYIPLIIMRKWTQNAKFWLNWGNVDVLFFHMRSLFYINWIKCYSFHCWLMYSMAWLIHLFKMLWSILHLNVNLNSEFKQSWSSWLRLKMFYTTNIELCLWRPRCKIWCYSPVTITEHCKVFSSFPLLLSLKQSLFYLLFNKAC